MIAEEFISKACFLVGGDRAETHGEKKKNMDDTARLWTAWLAAKGISMFHKNSTETYSEACLTGEDVAVMMTLFKIGRIPNGTKNADDYIDAIGYMGIAGEVSGVEENKPSNVTQLRAEK